MPSNADHIRRDAEHASRSAIRVEVSRYLRRMDESAKAHIAEALAQGVVEDGIALGYEAARSATAPYLSPGTPQPAIESGDPTS